MLLFNVNVLAHALSPHKIIPVRARQQGVGARAVPAQVLPRVVAV